MIGVPPQYYDMVNVGGSAAFGGGMVGGLSENDGQCAAEKISTISTNQYQLLYIYVCKWYLCDFKTNRVSCALFYVIRKIIINKNLYL
jgi:hypothetical protein